METGNQIIREQVVAELKKIADRGVRHPDELNRLDPDIAQAQELFFAYARQETAKAKEIGTPEAELERSLDLSTVEADSGFTDPEYLDEVANDWLAQDEQSALDSGLTALASKIKARAEALNNQIKS